MRGKFHLRRDKNHFNVYVMVFQTALPHITEPKVESYNEKRKLEIFGKQL